MVDDAETERLAARRSRPRAGVIDAELDSAPFTAAGLTQIPPGPHLRTLQGRYGGGVVMLCIDVSGSMDGKPILEAVRGAK